MLGTLLICCNPGRSVSSCQNAFNALLARSQPNPMAAPMTDPTGRRLKRSYAAGEGSTSGAAREIQPRPPSFSSVNGQQQIVAPAPIAMSPVEPPRKKRGRPTKFEYEKRAAEAKERGEVWPKPRKPKTPRTSMEGVEATGAASGAGGTPASVGAEGTPEESQRTPSMGGPGSGQAPTAIMYTPGTQGMGVPMSPSIKKQPRAEAPLPPGTQVQHEEMRAARGGGASEAQLSEFQASQNLLSGFSQHPQLVGSPHLPQAGSPNQMQSPYGSAAGSFQGFSMEDRSSEQQPQ